MRLYVIVTVGGSRIAGVCSVARLFDVQALTHQSSQESRGKCEYVIVYVGTHGRVT